LNDITSTSASAGSSLMSAPDAVVEHGEVVRSDRRRLSGAVGDADVQGDQRDPRRKLRPRRAGGDERHQ
jgi:hypothetical protein